MSDYYPIEDREDIDLDLLLKRLKANGIFPQLSEAEVLHLLCWHQWSGHIKFFTWELEDIYFGSSIPIPEQVNIYLEGKNFLFIQGFHKCDDVDLAFNSQGQPNHYYVFGSVFGSPHNRISIDMLGFRSFPIDYVRISKADVNAIETGRFRELNQQEKREVKLHKYIETTPDFAKRCTSMRQGEAWEELTRYDSNLFPPLGEKAISGFWGGTDLKFKQGRPEKNK